MDAKHLAAGAVIGTACMTFFSYVVSGSKDKEFREPVILGKLAKRAVPSLNKDEALTTGWILHAGAGIFFTAFYPKVLKWMHVKQSIGSGAALGALNGLAGIAVWRTVFELHPNPPSVHRNRYYGHLLIAHIVFGAGIIAGLKLMDEK